jgi:hypothetical protein
MCTQCGCADTAVTIKAPVRVAAGQDASVIKGFDVPPPYGKGKE